MKQSGIGFKPQPKLSELDPGIQALGLRVLVLSRELEEKTAGGIYITKVEMGDLQRQEDAGSEGLLVSIGEVAGYERWPKLADGSPDYGRGHPRVGDTVLFARYSGKHSEFTGRDGRTYRIMNDEDILGLRVERSVEVPAGGAALGGGAAKPAGAKARAKAPA